MGSGSVITWSHHVTGPRDGALNPYNINAVTVDFTYISPLFLATQWEPYYKTLTLNIIT